MQNSEISEQEAFKSGLKITADNADRFLEYHEVYGVLICVKHGYAVRNLADHLSRNHTGSKKERSDVCKQYKSLVLHNAKDVPLPPPLEDPIPALGEPQRAFICREPECQHISISRKGIRLHCNQSHNWKSSTEEREHWNLVWVQTFFKSAGLQRYFTVLYDKDEETDRQVDETEAVPCTNAAGETATTRTIDDPEFAAIKADWKEQNDKLREELEVADTKTAKTDHTSWFKKTGWAEHLKGCTLRHLSRASRLPDREEQTLHEAVKLNSILIEKCVAGLSSLDNETRRWLRSAKHSEIDQRPLARLQNIESQRTYTTYIARLLCYSLRVLQSCEDSEKLESVAESESDNNQGSESDKNEGSEQDEDEGSEQDEDEGSELGEDKEDEGDSGASSNIQAVTDVFKDARRLYPWQGRQKDLLRRVRESIEKGWDEESRLKALLEFYDSLIFQRVRGDTFKSVILHFLAVLGIDGETRRLRQANDFSYMLAGIVYCVRVIAIEVILPSKERDNQGDADDERFRRTRDEFLADGTYSVMSKALSILAYGKSIAMDHSNAGSISWSEDEMTMSYKGKPIEIARFRNMVRAVIEEAEGKLWRDLMWTVEESRFEIPLDKLQDDVNWTKRGVSFVDNANNRLQDKQDWMIKRALTDDRGRKLRKQGEWSRPEVHKYLRKVDQFRELLLLCIHTTGGQPARGTEITSVRFRNGFQQDRNVFAIQGHMAVVTRYHKSQSQFDKPKVIPRFLPWRVGQLLAVYLAYVQPFQQYLTVKVRGLGRTDHIWSNEYGPWGTDRLMEYRPGEQNPAALVFISADFVSGSQFLSYAQLLSAKGILRRVFVDECHLTFTASDWRPKLAEVRAVRGLRVPIIMLTATLPVLLEFELEESMAASMARYIRAVTTRTKTRYIVEVCKPGKLEEKVLELCKRMKKHLGLRKGVVYSRSRDQCERLARMLRCAYYHAGAADNEESLKAWLERGGLIVATSALGTGIDFPGIVFTLHVDVPYGMIDFAQESGRAGRAGEDVDSVIVVEEGKAERQAAGGKARNVDESIMRDFITTRNYRRRVMGLYLDNKEIECRNDASLARCDRCGNKEIECRNDASLARCDRCGEGVTALERDYVRAANERQIVEETLDEVTDGCAFCFVESTDDVTVKWTHRPEECERADYRRWGDLDDRFRRLIRFEEDSHSCFKCGFSQKLCATGVDEGRACQWPNVAAALLRGIPSTRRGSAIVEEVGFEGETADAKGYASWLGRRHRQRVWGELMSNASAVVIKFIVERAKIQAEADATDTDDFRIYRGRDIEAEYKSFIER